MAWKESVFVTLTYRNEKLPKYQSLDKDEFMRFWKRLRKLVAPRRIRYYGSGEYGMHFNRPHYHAIIFGLGLKDAGLVNDAWGHGFVKVGTLTYQSARYVADYIGKFDSREFDDGLRQKPFSVMSKGIGKGFVGEFEKELRELPRLAVRGVERGMPRYYVKLLRRSKMRKDSKGSWVFDDEQEEKRLEFERRLAEIRHARERVLAEFHRARSDGSPEGIRASMERSAAQRGIDAERRAELRKGK